MLGQSSLGALISMLPSRCRFNNGVRLNEPPVGLFDEQGRYLTMPAVGTTVYLVGKPFRDFSATAESGIVLSGGENHVLIVTAYCQREYYEDGQIQANLSGRHVEFKREPMFVTAEAAFKFKYSDVYQGEHTRISQEVFQEKFNAS